MFSSKVRFYLSDYKGWIEYYTEEPFTYNEDKIEKHLAKYPRLLQLWGIHDLESMRSNIVEYINRLKLDGRGIHWMAGSYKPDHSLPFW